MIFETVSSFLSRSQNLSFRFFIGKNVLSPVDFENELKIMFVCSVFLVHDLLNLVYDDCIFLIEGEFFGLGTHLQTCFPIQLTQIEKKGKCSEADSSEGYGCSMLLKEFFHPFLFVRLKLNIPKL